MAVTQEQAQALAGLACAARPHGAPQWDPIGVMAAIRKVAHLALADVALAVMRAADDRELKTPGAIGNPTTGCWRERAGSRPEQHKHFDRQHTCGICGFSEDACRIRWAHDHDFEPIDIGRKKRLPADQAAEIVAELRDKTRHDQTDEKESA